MILDKFYHNSNYGQTSNNWTNSGQSIVDKVVENLAVKALSYVNEFQLIPKLHVDWNQNVSSVQVQIDDQSNEQKKSKDKQNESQFDQILDHS